MNVVNTNRYRQPVKKPRISSRLWVLLGILLILGLVEIGIIFWKLADKQQVGSNRNTSSTAPPNSQEASFDKTKYSISEADSIWAVVNKGRTLPPSYIPSNLVTPDVELRYSAGGGEMRLRPDAARALKELFMAAAKEKIFLRLSSGYRSYLMQNSIYAREVKTYGQTQADRQSARPGHSEHQTGLAADLAPAEGRCEIADCFANTAEGKWLAANSYIYGFILRYASNKEAVTGYRYEPWHFRYVGKELAIALNKNSQIIEQFFDLQSYAAYPSEIYKLR